MVSAFPTRAASCGGGVFYQLAVRHEYVARLNKKCRREGLPPIRPMKGPYFRSVMYAAICCVLASPLGIGVRWSSAPSALVVSMQT